MAGRNRTGLMAETALSVGIAVALLTGGCGRVSFVVESHWATQNTVVDGKLDDWDKTPLTYFEESQVSFGLKNDTEELCLLFCIRDERWVRMIATTGITLWLDPTGEKKRDFGMRYSCGPLPQVLGARGSDQSDIPQSEERMRPAEKRRDEADKITIIVGCKDSTIVVPADGSNGPAIQFGESEGLSTYEFSIPLGQGKGNYYALDAQSGGTVSMGIEWGGPDGDAAGSMRGSMGGTESPRGIPGGKRGRWGTVPGGRYRQTPQGQEVWLKTTLASPGEEG